MANNKSIPTTGWEKDDEYVEQQVPDMKLAAKARQIKGGAHTLKLVTDTSITTSYIGVAGVPCVGVVMYVYSGGGVFHDM